MDPEEADDTGVFSPPASKQNITLDQDIRDKETSVSETDGTDVFSPDVSFRSRFVRSLNSPASKENTPPHTETPSITKQLEGIERKGAKRKQHFSDALNSQPLNDDSYNKVEDILDDLKSREGDFKRIKRFHLSAEESANDSKSEDTGVFSLGTATSSSQDEANTKRKSRFELMNSPSFQDSEDSLFSDVFGYSKDKTRKPPQNRHSEELNNEIKMKRKSRFEPPASSEESLQYSAIFNSVSKDKNKTKHRHGFVIPSSQNSDESRYSDVFESVFSTTDKPKRNNRFVTSNFQQNEESLCYSDLSITRSETNTRKKHHFVEPASQEQSISYSDISAPQNESNVEKSNRFIDPASQETGNSLGYSNILLSQNETNVEKSTPFIDPASQEIENSLGYSNLLPSQNESSVRKKQPFVDPASQGIENSLGYSNILPSQNESNVEKRAPFADPSSQGTENSLGYSNVLSSQNESNVDKRKPFVSPASQDIEDSSHYSEITISIDGSERLSRFAVPSCQNSENSITLEKCEKTSSTNFTSIRSICIDTVRSSFNISTPSLSKITDKPINLTYDVPNSAFCPREAVSSSVNINSPSTNKLQNDTYDLGNIATLKVPVVSTLDVSCERTLVGSDSLLDINQSNTLIESKIESSRDQESSSVVDEFENESADVEESSLNPDKSENRSSTVQESDSVDEESEKEDTEVQESSTVQESDSVDEESEKEDTDEQEPDSTADESENRNSTMQESVSIDEESEKEGTNVQELDSMGNESKNENATIQESIPMIDESENDSAVVQKSIPATNEIRNMSTSAQESIPATESIMIDTIPNSSTVPPSTEKIVEESVYVDFNPSSVMLSVTVVEEPSNNFDGDFSIGKNESNHLVELPLIDGAQNNEPPSALPSSEENMKEHDYAAIQISNANLPSSEENANKSVAMEISYPEEPVTEGIFPVTAVAEISKETASTQADIRNIEETDKERVQPPTNIPCVENVPQEYNIVSSSVSEAQSVPNNVEIAETAQSLNASIGSTNRSLRSQKSILNTENEPITAVDSEAKSVSNDDEIVNKAPSLNASTRSISHSSRPRRSVSTVGKEPVTSVSSEAKSSTNDVEIIKKPPSSNSFTSSASRSLRSRRSVSKVGNEQVASVDSEAKSTSNDVEIAEKPPSPNSSNRSANRSCLQKSTEPAPSVGRDVDLNVQKPSSTAQDPEKSTPVSPTNDNQSRPQSIISIDPKPKSNYSLRSRNSRSSGAQKSPEPVPSTSAGVPITAPMDNTGDGFFNLSNSVNDTPSRNFSIISSSRSRNSTSSKTFASRSSLSVFSKSKIGRPSTAPSEFKVPAIPKVVLRKKKTKKNDKSFAHLPSKPNFPKFDFYCNKRFYDHLTSKLEPKYGIRTNNEAVKLAQYISDVVREVIAMKTDDHHILIEEMKVALFRKGIVTTHYNFYMYCFDYLPSWFRRRAVPMMVPKGCQPRVKFDLSLLFNSIE